MHALCVLTYLAYEATYCTSLCLSSLIPLLTIINHMICTGPYSRDGVLPVLVPDCTIWSAPVHAQATMLRVKGLWLFLTRISGLLILLQCDAEEPIPMTTCRCSSRRGKQSTSKPVVYTVGPQWMVTHSSQNCQVFDEATTYRNTVQWRTAVCLHNALCAQGLHSFINYAFSCLDCV